MTCDDLQPLLHGYVDGELDLVHYLEAEQHLQSCPGCARACKRLQVLQAALRGRSFRFQPPPGLRERIGASLRELDHARPARRPGRWLAVAACAAMVVFAIWGVLSFWPYWGEDERVAQEVVASHVRSLMVDRHLTDKPSTDTHEVKPWFQGKIDFVPDVPNLDGEGFFLKGGRLDYLNNRSVAALVYQRRRHTINLLVWPSPGSAGEEPRALTRQGYQIVHWTQAGMTCWAVSDLNAEELRAFVDLVRRKGQR